jgi:hypothetical protein
LLASIAIASPIASPEAEAVETTELTTRAPTYVDSWEYKEAIAAHSGLTKDNYYWFTLEWPIGTVVGDDDKESQPEITALRRQLGYDHVGIVIGQITETTGKGKDKDKVTRDFKASVYHMVVKDAVKDTTDMVPRNFNNHYEPQVLRWGGLTSKKKVDKATKTAKGYIKADAKHEVYNVDSNNCNTFVTAVKADL